MMVLLKNHRITPHRLTAVHYRIHMRRKDKKWVITRSHCEIVGGWHRGMAWHKGMDIGPFDSQADALSWMLKHNLTSTARMV